MNRIRLFVDDERPAFEGWTLAKTFHEAIGYFYDEDDEKGLRITELSLDWNLGPVRQLDGKFLVEEMCSRVYYFRLPIFDELQTVYFHTSDDYMAKQMLDLFEAAIEMEQIPVKPKLVLNLNAKKDYGRKDA